MPFEGRENGGSVAMLIVDLSKPEDPPLGSHVTLAVTLLFSGSPSILTKLSLRSGRLVRLWTLGLFSGELKTLS